MYSIQGEASSRINTARSRYHGARKLLSYMNKYGNKQHRSNAMKMLNRARAELQKTIMEETASMRVRELIEGMKA